MIVYEGTVQKFINECKNKTIAKSVVDSLRQKLGMSVGASEMHAYEASLPVVAKALESSSLPGDVGVGVEYRLRFGKARIDFMVYGYNAIGQKNVVVLELKQWSTVQRSGKPNHVYANVGGGKTEDHCHPSMQALNYIGQLRNFNEYIQDNNVGLTACSYLHNMPNINEIILLDKDQYPFVVTSPAFLKDDVSKLVDFIGRYVTKACPTLLYEIDHSLIRPSIHLSKTLGQALAGNQFFAYDDQQENAISEIIAQVKDALEYNERRVILIKGAPGTGKSVVALNVLGQLMNPPKGGAKYNAAYFAVNAALRTLYTKELIGDDYKKGFIKEVLKYPTVLKDAPACSFDCGLFDEAHRLFDFKGGVGMSRGQHLLEASINACRVSVFFIDGDQRVTRDDFATEERIREVAKKLKIRVISGPELELTAQYRCLGGDEYIELVRNFLGYESKRTRFDLGQYEFKVVDSPEELFELIREKDIEVQKEIANREGKIFIPNHLSGRCRVVAGYTHNWVSKGENRDGPDYDFDFGNGLKKKWNLRCGELGADYSWLDDPESVDEIGCIHTCQGLDLNYCGVIIGRDLRYKNGQLIFDKTQNAKTDSASQIRNVDDDYAGILIRNTYNVLLTRGMKGTFVYCEDQELAKYLKSFIKKV